MDNNLPEGNHWINSSKNRLKTQLENITDTVNLKEDPCNTKQVPESDMSESLVVNTPL